MKWGRPSSASSIAPFRGAERTGPGFQVRDRSSGRTRFAWQHTFATAHIRATVAPFRHETAVASGVPG
jgi:hypothetical protein